MAEGQQPTGEGSRTSATGGAQGGQGAQGAGGDQGGTGVRMFDQAKVQRIVAKETRKVAAELEQAKAELEKLRGASGAGDDEAKRKAELEQAEARGRKAVEETLKSERISHRLEIVARDAGVHPDFVPALRAKLGEDLDLDSLSDDVAEIVEKFPHFKAATVAEPTATEQPKPAGSTSRNGAPSGRPPSRTIKQSELNDHKVWSETRAGRATGEIKVVPG